MSAATPTPSGKFHELFVLPMQQVLLAEIHRQFDLLAPVTLSKENLDTLRLYEAMPRERPVKKGLYLLHHQGTVCYAGKTDESLYGRLSDHFIKIWARKGITPGEIGFRCLYLDENWSASAHEEGLIQHFKGHGLCAWNDSGFGIHDPGRRRDTTQLDETHFDRLFPVDPDIEINLAVKKGSIIELLNQIKIYLPYLLRFETRKKSDPTFKELGNEYSKKIDLSSVSPLTAKNIVYAVVDALGPQWQTTFLYGYVIVYKENMEYGPKCRQCFKIGGKPENTI